MNHGTVRRILVVDDNHAIHDDFRKILTLGFKGEPSLEDAERELFSDGERGHEPRVTFQIDSAYQGKDAVELVLKAAEASEPYEMAFVDIRMPPGWDGVETVARIWERYPDLEVVVCTALSDYSWEQMVGVLGHSDRLLILKKPFDNIEVRQLAYALTEKWRLRTDALRTVGELQAMLGEIVSTLPNRSEFESAGPRVGNGVLERMRSALHALNTQLVQRAQESEQRAQRDGLTALYNRAYLDLQLTVEFERARRTGQPLSLLFCDLDHFKEVNDTFGHRAGDEVLVAVANVLRSSVREPDLVARYGGEEFVCLLPGTGAAQAEKVGQRLRESVGSQVVAGGKERVTVSLGCATLEPGRTFASPREMLEAADRCLYAAKRGGRNRVVTLGAPSQQEG
ncbi:MAG: diguanylate cyclase [Myxococcales bacterium]|nr:diguanylate cyclase [Myxococcales bacterium]